MALSLLLARIITANAPRVIEIEISFYDSAAAICSPTVLGFLKLGTDELILAVKDLFDALVRTITRIFVLHRSTANSFSRHCVFLLDHSSCCSLMRPLMHYLLQDLHFAPCLLHFLRGRLLRRREISLGCLLSRALHDDIE